MKATHNLFVSDRNHTTVHTHGILAHKKRWTDEFSDF